MKSKYILSLVLIVAVLFICEFTVNANSNHYLPGGKNYLDENNFEVYGSHYNTIDEFLIKPYTDYTLTIPYLYYDLEDAGVEILLYNGDVNLAAIFLYPEDFYSCTQDSYCYSFKTRSNTDYIEIDFYDDGAYFTGNGLSGFQLEEGLSFTGYETYVSGEITNTSSPYFVSVNKIVSYYDSPLTISEIQNSLTAYDSIDGDLSSSINLVSDGYTANNDVLGIYQCEFEVTDNSNNTSSVVIDVEVVDVLKPVFSDIGVVSAVYPNVYTTADILSMLSASDNYDGDISNQIVLVSENYLANSSSLGTYHMQFSVSDSSGNTEYYTLVIEVIDEDAPMIDGPDSISVDYDSLLSESELLQLYTCTDDFDEASTLTLVVDSNPYINSSDTLGNYIVVLSVEDSSGNVTNKNVTINVVDQIGPIIYMDFSIIQTYTDTVMALPDFVNLLVNVGELDKLMNYSVKVVYDSYTDNSNVPGIYHLSLCFEDELGNSIDKDFELRVSDRGVDYEYEPEIPEEDVTGYTSKVSNYIIGGILTFMLAATNIIWFIILKKRN